jgi:hypothetical protein
MALDVLGLMTRSSG